MKVSTFRHLFKPLRPREQYMVARLQQVASAQLLGWSRRHLAKQQYLLRRAAFRRQYDLGKPTEWEHSWNRQVNGLLKRLTPEEAITYVIFQRQGVTRRGKA